MDYKGSSCHSNGVGMLCKSVFDWVGEAGNGDMKLNVLRVVLVAR